MRSLLPVIALLAACSEASAPMEMASQAEQKAVRDEGGPSGGFAPPAPAAPASEADASAAPTRGAKGRADAFLAKEAPAEPAPDAAQDGGEALREWFPEAFLWRPVVETDATGKASVEVRVPDTLTTWRVLALAHSRDGAQAGAVYTFDSSMPLYVDPVVPGWLHAGDRVELPVQVVNTTRGAVQASVRVEASGALAGGGAASLMLPAGGSDVRRVALTATSAGEARVRAVLAGADAAERTIPVLPEGRPVENVRGGTLSSTRAFTIDGPDGADPRTRELAVLVFPGPLAVMQAELERAGGGAGAAEAAYGFALAGRLHDLSAQAGTDVDPKVMRKLQLTSWQRIVPHVRAPDAVVAADVLASLGDPKGHELAEQLKARLVTAVVRGQRGDGTWALNDTGTRQLVIARTAWTARALPTTADGARIRAKGALQRHSVAVEDPYTAALVLAAGLVDAPTADKLRKIVLDGLVTAEDDRKTVSVPDGVRNPWGTTPSRAEMLAWTALALPDAPDVRGDLVAELMGGWDATWGFGAGPADVIALEAVATALPGLPKPVDVVLVVDGREAARARLDPAQPKLPAVLEARPGAADPQVELRVEPAVPGLAFVSTLRSYVPWSDRDRLPGVDVAVKTSKLAVGRDGLLAFEIAAPSGVQVTVEQGLPAGAAVEDTAFAALGDRLVDWRVTTDRVRFTTRAFGAGEVMTLEVPVRPAFAGRFATTPLTVSAAGRDAQLAPAIWTVAPGD